VSWRCGEFPDAPVDQIRTAGRVARNGPQVHRARQRKRVGPVARAVRSVGLIPTKCIGAVDRESVALISVRQRHVILFGYGFSLERWLIGGSMPAIRVLFT